MKVTYLTPEIAKRLKKGHYYPPLNIRAFFDPWTGAHYFKDVKLPDPNSGKPVPKEILEAIGMKGPKENKRHINGKWIAGE